MTPHLLTVSDRFQERQRLFQRNYKPHKTPKELLNIIRKDRNRHDRNTPSNADSTVIVLGTDAAGETIYDLTDEQLANCLSQPWSKWTSHFSPDGILQVDQSEKLESNIRTSLAYQSTLPHKQRFIFGENMCPPPVPEEGTTPLNSFTARDSTYAKRVCDYTATPTLDEYTKRMLPVSSQQNFSPETHKGFQKEVSAMTHNSHYSVAQILYQPFLGMFSQTGDSIFQGQLQGIGGFALHDDTLERPRQRSTPGNPGKRTAPVSAIISDAASQLSKLTVQQSHRWDQKRLRLPEVVYDAINFLSKCSARLIKTGQASITENCRQEAVVWESCQKAVVNLLKLHSQMLSVQYPSMLWPESYLSAWLSGDQAAAFTWADPNVPPTTGTYILENMYSMNIGSGQNAFSVMLNEYSAHGSTNTQQLVINAVSYAYTGQGGKMFVLDLEKRFTEGRENAKPPVGCASHPAFSNKNVV